MGLELHLVLQDPLWNGVPQVLLVGLALQQWLRLSRCSCKAHIDLLSCSPRELWVAWASWKLLTAWSLDQYECAFRLLAKSLHNTNHSTYKSTNMLLFSIGNLMQLWGGKKKRKEDYMLADLAFISLKSLHTSQGLYLFKHCLQLCNLCDLESKSN